MQSGVRWRRKPAWRSSRPGKGGLTLGAGGAAALGAGGAAEESNTGGGFEPSASG
jgi:hypothetical protein